MSISSRPFVAVVLALSTGCATTEWRTGTNDLGMTSTSASLERIVTEQPDSVRLVMGRDFTRVLHQPSVEGDTILRGYRSPVADTFIAYRVADVERIQFPVIESGGKKIGTGLMAGFFVAALVGIWALMPSW